jgi:hypothetical protein
MIIANIENVDDFYFDVFISISSATVGFEVNDLISTGLGETYYKHILNSVEEGTFLEFLNVSREILESSHSEAQLNIAISEQLVAHEGMKEVLDKVITLWYLGTWDGFYVTPNSYTQGLAWKVIPAHPPGAKQPGFQSWNVKPV